MNVPEPHFLLLANSRRRNHRDEWSFVLQAADGSAKLEAHETEAHARGERLELLSVVRGLEALDQPSCVTLVTSSRYVRRGIAHGLEDWRHSGWTWESFGQRVPVKNRDLWQRLDRAMSFHRIELRTWRVDSPHHVAPPAAPDFQNEYEDSPELAAPKVQPRAIHRRGRAHRGVRQARLRRRLMTKLSGWRATLEQLGTSLLPRPWID